jgi:hypothetical protein
VRKGAVAWPLEMSGLAPRRPALLRSCVGLRQWGGRAFVARPLLRVRIRLLRGWSALTGARHAAEGRGDTIDMFALSMMFSMMEPSQGQLGLEIFNLQPEPPTV